MGLLVKIVDRLSAAIWALGMSKPLGEDHFRSLLPEPIWDAEVIPKSMHQTFYTKDLSPELLDNVEHLKRLHPEWSYTLWDDQDIEVYIKEHYGQEMWGYFSRINPAYGAAKADFFRYLLIYNEGGVYLDIKSTLHKSLDTLITSEHQMVVSFWDNEPGGLQEGLWLNRVEYPGIVRGEIMQWFIIARRRHPMIYRIILNMLHKIDTFNPGLVGHGLWATLKTTGPHMYTYTIWENRDTLDRYITWVNACRDWEIEYSIYSKPGEAPLHKKVMKHNYYRLSVPLIVNTSSLAKAGYWVINMGLQTVLKAYRYILSLRGRRDLAEAE